MKDKIDLALQGAFLGTNKLSQAISYALLSGGKRIRPQIVCYIAEGLGHNLPVLEAALAVEFFHTASLIADDLPCMDNDTLRRGKKSVHAVFGESVALLASYALISEAFKKIEENGRKMALNELFFPKAYEATIIGLEEASRAAGIKGAVLGQYYDLFHESEGKMTEAFLEELMYLKTGTLFQGAFVLGWVFGGGEFSYLDEVRRLARHMGLAFQIRDDLKDLAQDDKNGSVNFALLVGKELAQERFHLEINSALELLDNLPIEKTKLRSLLVEV